MDCVRAKWLQVKRSLHARVFQNESGQAVIEYVLVLMVSVAVILGSLYQFSDAFRSWADSYFGDYLACLIESGELPTLDGGSGTCNAEFKPFSFAEGRQLISSAAGSGSSSDDAQRNAAAAAAAARAAGQSTSFSTGRSRFGSSSNRFAAKPGSGSESSKKGDGSDTGGFGTTDLSGYQQGRVVRIPVREVDGYGRRGKFADEEKRGKEKTKVTAAEVGGAEVKRTTLMKVTRKPAASKPPEIEPFTFGNFLRYIIIAAIIIAIVFFIGGQALQVSKSMD